MSRIVIVGAAGRMGRRLVANILDSEDLELTGAVDAASSPFIGKDAGSVAGEGACGVEISTELEPLLDNADVIIDFSTGAVVEHIRAAAEKNIGIVVGTTALPDDVKKEIETLAKNGARIVFSSNFSVGVNLLFYLSKIAVEILGPGYDVEIVEMHHNQKKDAPSGTAATLAEIITGVRNLSYEKDVRHGRKGLVGARTENEVGMHAIRGGDVVGDHTVIFATGGERVELTHKASNRDTFAKGALRAARFLANAKPGLYDMLDVLGME